MSAETFASAPAWRKAAATPSARSDGPPRASPRATLRKALILSTTPGPTRAAEISARPGTARARHAARDQDVEGLDAVQERQDDGAGGGEPPHGGSGPGQRVALEGDDREIGGDRAPRPPPRPTRRRRTRPPAPGRAGHSRGWPPDDRRGPGAARHGRHARGPLQIASHASGADDRDPQGFRPSAGVRSGTSLTPPGGELLGPLPDLPDELVELPVRLAHVLVQVLVHERERHGLAKGARPPQRASRPSARASSRRAAATRAGCTSRARGGGSSGPARPRPARFSDLRRPGEDQLHHAPAIVAVAVEPLEQAVALVELQRATCPGGRCS